MSAICDCSYLMDILQHLAAGEGKVRLVFRGSAKALELQGVLKQGEYFTALLMPIIDEDQERMITYPGREGKEGKIT